MEPIVTIIIPNYKTPEITKLCLRLINKHTDISRVKVIVVDNNSNDSSTEYLRSLRWIDLIERPPEPDDTPSLSHSRALDLALELVQTPYVLSIHTDTLIHHDGWLDFLLEEIKKDDNIAGVGSWKLEVKPKYKRALKTLEAYWESIWFKFKGRDRNSLEGLPSHIKYLRSHCAL